MSIDNQGRSHAPEGTSAGGRFEQERLGEPAAASLDRAVTYPPIRTPAREVGYAIAGIREQVIGVQVREELQTSLKALRALRPDLRSIELADYGDGSLTFSAAFDTAGDDITVSNWRGRGDEHISDVTLDPGSEDFDILNRDFDVAGHLVGLATDNDEHLALDVDVDQALAANANNPEAVNPEAVNPAQKRFAIGWGSRELEKALYNVRVSEGREYVNEMEKLAKDLPADITEILIYKHDEDEQYSITLYGEGNRPVRDGSETTRQIEAYAEAIECSIDDIMESRSPATRLGDTYDKLIMIIKR